MQACGAMVTEVSNEKPLGLSIIGCCCEATVSY